MTEGGREGDSSSPLPSDAGRQSGRMAGRRHGETGVLACDASSYLDFGAIITHVPWHCVCVRGGAFLVCAQRGCSSREQDGRHCVSIKAVVACCLLWYTLPRSLVHTHTHTQTTSLICKVSILLFAIREETNSQPVHTVDTRKRRGARGRYRTIARGIRQRTIEASAQQHPGTPASNIDVVHILFFLFCYSAQFNLPPGTK